MTPTRERPERHRCFAACLPGLEPLVADELAALGVRHADPGAGGVPFTATTRQLYAANLHLACATRVLVRLGAFTARSFRELEGRAAELPWADVLPAGVPVELRVTARSSKLHHTGAIAERISGVVESVLRDRDGWAPGPPAAGEPAQLVVVRLGGDRVTISIDSSGEPLHRRSWRLATAKAPLRPTLAAALLTVSGWDPATPLVDPFCGSGTVAIEAARRARAIPAGWGRSFAFAEWPGFQPGTWASVVASADEAVLDRAPAPVVAADRDAGAVATTTANAERAGVGDDVEVRNAAISALAEADAVPVGTGAVVTNPPYGKRVSGPGDLRDLYDRTGDVLRATMAGWRVGVVVADPVLAGHLRIPLEDVVHTTNGGIRIRLVRGRVPGVLATGTSTKGATP